MAGYINYLNDNGVFKISNCGKGCHVLIKYAEPPQFTADDVVEDEDRDGELLPHPEVQSYKNYETKAVSNAKQAIYYQGQGMHATTF